MEISSYAFISAGLFIIGIFTMLSRRNAIYVLMGAELILNAAALNFVAFARHRGPEVDMDGQMFAIFIIILAAAEAAIALGIVLQLYQHFPSIDVSKPNTMSD